MKNNVFLIGRLTRKPELQTTEDGKNYAYINLAVPRSYKNADGEYITDFIDCTVYGTVAEATCNYNDKGDLVGVQGQVNSISYEEDGINKNKLSITANKITFLANKEKMDEIKKDNPEAVELN